MKRAAAVFSFLCMFLFLHAQKVISLADGTIADSKDKKQYIRDVKIEDDGVLVTYVMDYATVTQDPIYPDATMLQMEGFGYNSNIGEPYIPKRIDSFTVPEGKTAEIVVVDRKYIDIPLRLSPARPVLSEVSYEGYSTSNVPPIVAFSGLYPTETVKEFGIRKYRGVSIAQVCVQPVQYNYKDSSTRVYSRITYKVVFKDGYRNSNKKIISKDDNLLRNTTLNNGILETVSKKAVSASNGVDVTKDYLIITTPTYASAANRFAQWKRFMGYRVNLSIRSSWTATDVQTEVESKYDSLDNLYYVLIVGSHSQIPGKQMGDMNYYTDYYYGCMDGANDDLPDVYVGRIPATTLNEANTVFNKIINYEQTPVTDYSFYNKGMNCAQFICSNNGYEQRRFTQTAERIRDYMVGIGKTVNRVYYAESDATPLYWNNNSEYYGTGGGIPSYLQKPQFAWDGDADDIISGINNGAFYVLHRDHGQVDEWVQPWFNVSHLSQLNNGSKLPVIFNICCDAGQYSNVSSRCLADCMLTMSNGGSVGGFAATLTTLSGPNDALAEGIFESIWPSPGLLQTFGKPNYTGQTSAPVYELGRILIEGLSKMLDLYPKIMYANGEETTWYKWARRAFVCFGDPSMEIRTEVPQAFNDISVNRLPNSINVNLGNESGRITFYNTQTGSVSAFDGISATYNGESSHVVVCVYGHNKIPLLNTSSTPYYIQNEMVTGNKTIGAGVIKIGSNVTDTKPQGPVTFSNGIINLYGNSVEIQGETTVTLGTELNITNE